MQKNPPALERRVEHLFKLQIVVDDHETSAGVVAAKRGLEVRGVYGLLRRFTLEDDVLVGVPCHVEVQGVIGLSR